ncbi:chain-length determining protein [Cupriavidus sp. 2TAF22]|uniref:chain-length determining protein n=1 Tax=unclassified Cupriavidus TaxID=2640874 RepID=UPI003F9067F7
MNKLLREIRQCGWPWRIAIAASILAIVYWGVVAADRYVSEAKVVVERSDAVGATTTDFYASLLGANAPPRDLLLLREYLLSVDMLNKLDATLALKGHYSDPRRDALSRLWPADASLERFHDYYLGRVSVEYDDYSRTLVVRAQAFTPAMAQAVTRALVEEGERFINDLTHRVAEEQVVYIERQARTQGERMKADRQALLAYQNANGIVSPRGDVESLSGVVAAAESELADLRVKRAALKDVYTPQSPAIQQLDAQIVAVQAQIGAQRARMTSSSGKALNRVAEQQERLQAAAGFSEDLYKTALSVLEKARMESTRKLKNVAVVQNPTLPEYPLQPRRLYNIVVFVLGALMLAGVLQLLGAIIRDHRD